MLYAVHQSQELKVSSTMWIGIMLVCFDPMALSCQVIAKPKPFYSEEVCLKEAEELATTIRQKGAYATPYCHKVEGGSA